MSGSSSQQGSRLMSIHSMLGTTTNHEPHMGHKRESSGSRPSSATEPHSLAHHSLSSTQNYHQSSQSSLPSLHDSSRFYPPPPPPPQQKQEVFNHNNLFQSSHPARFQNGNSTIQTGHVSIHTPPNMTHMPFPQASSEWSRDRQREERQELKRDATRTPISHTEHSRSHQASPVVSATHHHHHHHHHAHRAHTPFKRPPCIIKSHQVFEECKNHKETYLGHWTYNPTLRLPFKLSINAKFTVHIPKRFLDPIQNSSLRKRKVWGSEIYTDDSDIAALVTHARPSLPSEALQATLRVMPRLMKYKSSMSGDLRSRGWNAQHDGLSLFLESIDPVPWVREVRGRGYPRRAIKENAYLDKLSLKTYIPDWPAQRYEREGDDTIDEETSFVEPKGPLIHSIPNIL